MSFWTYIKGNMVVNPPGETQTERDYILDSVLRHLPKVTGSEGNMKYHVIKDHDYNESSSHDELDIYVPEGHNLIGEYLIVIYESLRDREFHQTYKEFINWLTRLANRCPVDSVFIKIGGLNCYESPDGNHKFEEKLIIIDDDNDLTRWSDLFDFDWINENVYRRHKEWLDKFCD